MLPGGLEQQPGWAGAQQQAAEAAHGVEQQEHTGTEAGEGAQHVQGPHAAWDAVDEEDGSEQLNDEGKPMCVPAPPPPPAVLLTSAATHPSLCFAPRPPLPVASKRKTKKRARHSPPAKEGSSLPKKGPPSHSNYHAVRWNAILSVWSGAIRHNGKGYNTAYYFEEEEAAHAVDRCVARLDGSLSTKCFLNHVPWTRAVLRPLRWRARAFLGPSPPRPPPHLQRPPALRNEGEGPVCTRGLAGTCTRSRAPRRATSPSRRRWRRSWTR